MQLNQVIALESGYQLEGVLNWETESYSNVFFDPFASNGFPASGREWGAYSGAIFESAILSGYAKSTQKAGWAIRTNDKNFISPWTLNVPQMMVDQNLKSEPIPFQIDFGPDPQAGFFREINRQLTIEDRQLLLVSAALPGNDRDGKPRVGIGFPQ